MFVTGANGSVRSISQDEWNRRDAQQAQLHADEARKNQGHRRLLSFGKLASVAIPTFGMGLGAAGGAAGANSTIQNTVAPTGKMSMGNLLRLGELGAGLFGNIFGQRSQNRANDQAARMQQEQFAQQQALLERQQIEDQRRWEAEEAFRAKQLASQEEERLYNRTLSEKQQRLLDEAEARKAPRRALSQQALMRISELLNARRG